MHTNIYNALIINKYELKHTANNIKMWTNKQSQQIINTILYYDTKSYHDNN